MRTPRPDSDHSHLDVAETFIAASRALVGIAVRSIGAAPVEITLPQQRAMVVLSADGAQSIGRLAEKMGVGQSNASRLCDRLERHGLVARERSSTDGRAVDVHLTSTGAELLADVHDFRRREVQRVLAGMAEGEVEAAVRGLDAFSRAAGQVSPSGESGQ